LRPRVGYAVGRFLPYVSGGLAFGEVDASQKLFVDGDFRQTGRVSEVQTGWMAAGGLQYAFTDKLSIRVEYQYSDLGTANYAVKPSERDLRFQGWGSTGLTEHSANFSVIYNFGPRGNAPGLSLPALPPPPPPPPPPP
jgi:opacity protein-like surface antigen